MTHCNILIKEFILGAECQKKKKKIEESGFAEPGFFLIWGCTCKLTCPISHHGSLEASLMFLLCCEEYQTRQEDKHIYPIP